MTSFPPMRSEQGRTSPSFLIAVLLVVLAVGGYASWRYFRPNPYRQSEQVVRDSKRGLKALVGEFEQSLRDLGRKSGLDAGQRRQEVDRLTRGAISDIDSFVDDARSQLADLDISLNTHQNRTARLSEKAEEAKEEIEERASAKLQQFGGG